MPRRTKKHITADMATSAVAGVISQAGHAVETVVQDYGEDLLVQTSHAGRMDASRLWFQVKGTDDIDRYRLKRGRFRISVDFDHALRWSRSTDLVVVVLWDVSVGVGWYALPYEQVDEWKGITSGVRTTTLRFAPDCQLTPAVVDELAWESRISHYRLLLLSAQNREKDLDDQGNVVGGGQFKAMVILDFLDLLDMVEPGEKSPDAFRFRPEVIEDFMAVLDKEPVDEEVESAIYMASITTVLMQAEKQCGHGLPTVLIEQAAEAFVVMSGLKKFPHEHAEAE